MKALVRLQVLALIAATAASGCHRARQPVQDRPVPAQNEIVMEPRTTLTATTSLGVMTITAGDGLKRSYTWEGTTRSVEMWPRTERWGDSLGLYFPGPGDHWQEHNGITRGVVEEGEHRFLSEEEAIQWIERWDEPKVYRNDGLFVSWWKVLERRQLNVEVWQILIDGERPTQLPGSQDDELVVSR